MLDQYKLALDDLVDLLKAAGEQTRMRLLALLSSSDLTVTDLTGAAQERVFEGAGWGQFASLACAPL